MVDIAFEMQIVLATAFVIENAIDTCVVFDCVCVVLAVDVAIVVPLYFCCCSCC